MSASTFAFLSIAALAAGFPLEGGLSLTVTAALFIVITCADRLTWAIRDLQTKP